MIRGRFGIDLGHLWIGFGSIWGRFGAHLGLGRALRHHAPGPTGNAPRKGPRFSCFSGRFCGLPSCALQLPSPPAPSTSCPLNMPLLACPHPFKEDRITPLYVDSSAHVFRVTYRTWVYAGAIATLKQSIMDVHEAGATPTHTWGQPSWGTRLPGRHSVDF